MSPISTLAQIAAGWHREPLDSALEHAARRVLLDWFATTLPGCNRAPATLLAKALLGEAGAGNAVSYVDGLSGPPRRAAFLNAAASHTVEFDDIFKDGGYHPGSPTVSAALALAQDRQATLEQFQRAVIAGYEVGCRISLAVQPSHYLHWHTTSTVGTMGAAAASAVLLGCDETEIAHALGLASSFAGGHQENLQGSGMAKAVHPAHAAEAGLLAAMAAAKGVTASLASLDAEHGFAAATSEGTGNWDAAFEGIGEWTPITRMTVKAHGCCGHIFPALDGLSIMMAEQRFSAVDVASIEVAGYKATKSMCDRPQPVTAQEARFSLQYCLAAQMVLGSVRLGAFEDATLGRADIRALMDHISVVEDASISAGYPRLRQARLSVRLRDGRILEHFQRTRRGDPEDPLDDAALIEKFEELAGEVLDRAETERLKTIVLSGTELPGELRFATGRKAVSVA